MPDTPRVLLGVTSDISLGLMRGFPRYLHDQGWEVHVVSAPGPQLDALADEPHITAHAVPMRREPSPLADVRSLAAWVRVLRSVRPHAVSIGTPKAGLLGTLAAWLTRVPLRVYHLRGLRLETSTGLQRAILTGLERLTMRTAHVVVAVSPSLRRRAIDLRLVRDARILVLGHGSSNGVDIPDAVPTPAERRTARERLGLNAGVPVIGFVGRLTADKGLAVLARARRLLQERGTDHQLLIVGGVDEQADTEIARELRSVGRPPAETGQVPDARPYFAAMDLLCLPTFREGFPNVVLEASAVGVPSVTTDATGAVDSVIDGLTGFIAAAGDPVSLADRLQELLEAGPDARAEMGAAARARVARDFGRDQVWGAMHALLRGTGEVGRSDRKRVDG